MTKEERLLVWKDIINGVFRAEHDVDNIENIRDGKNWVALLREAKVADEETRNKVADEYVEAIANQIMDCGYLRFEGDDW